MWWAIYRVGREVVIVAHPEEKDQFQKNSWSRKTQEWVC